MNFQHLIIAFLSLASCSKHPAKPSSSAAATQLKPIYDAKLSAYANEIPASNHGWPSVTDCDGTVWAGTACLGGVTVSLADAEYPVPGQIQRRPSSSGTCWVNGAAEEASASTVSRDDLVLYMGCAVATKNTDALKRLQTYASANPDSPAELGDWVGMPHDDGLTLMTPTLLGILSRALGGSGIDIEAPGSKDYQDNIEVEEVLLSTAVNGGTANGWELALLDSLVSQDPNDALFQAAKGIYSGDCTTAAGLLTNPGVVIPSYVRGDSTQLFADAWWLRAASLVLSHCT